MAVSAAKSSMNNREIIQCNPVRTALARQRYLKER